MTIKVTRKPDFTRLRKALLCEGEPDRVPNIELGVHDVFKGLIIGRSCSSVEDEVDYARIAGYDYIKIQPGINMNPGGILPAGGARVAATEEGGMRRWADEHDGIFRSLDDVERYVWPKPQDVSYARLEEAGGREDLDR